MKLTGGRFILVLLGLIAIVLLCVMIGLQLLIITNRDQATTNNSAQATQAESTSTLALALATDAPSPTSMPTFTSAPPTATAVPPTLTLAPPTPIPPTPVVLPPTVTPAPPTSVSTTVAVVAAPATALPTLVPPTATSTPGAPADLRIGYTERSFDCKLVTEIVQLALERQLKLHIATLNFKTTDDLFAALASTTANERVDLTFCYIDPDDRAYLANYGSSLRFLDSNYGQIAKQKFYAVINSALIARLKAEQPCMHNFLKKLDFGDMQFQEKSAEQWLNANDTQVAAWSQCS